MHDNLLQSRRITLRPATLEDRRMIYEWLAHSDVTATMLGSPRYPETPIPTWEEFCEDYQPYFFDGSAPRLGRSFLIVADADPVGQINYNDISEKDGGKRVELDIWMRASAWCGRGLGPDALNTLCSFLADAYGVREFMVQPSERNGAAIRAYEKAGFHRLNLTPDAAAERWGSRDYHDSVFMVRQAGTP
jgi:diamine N-acetyltransferase